MPDTGESKHPEVERLRTWLARIEAADTLYVAHEWARQALAARFAEFAPALSGGEGGSDA